MGCRSQSTHINVLGLGAEALNYFQENNPTAEKMQPGSNEAEWIVNLTTHADRDDKCASAPAPICRSVLGN